MPVYLFARGREPAHVKVIISENSEANLGSVVLKRDSDEDNLIKILGCAYTFVGETPEDLTYGMILEGNKYLPLKNHFKRLRTNQDGFYSMRVPREWLENSRITLSVGVLLMNKQVGYKNGRGQ